jgi:hypothetical protein
VTLQHCNLRQCDGRAGYITDTGMMTLANLTALRTLSVEFMSYDEDDERGAENDQVTDISLQALAGGLTALTALELAQWDRITDNGATPHPSPGRVASLATEDAGGGSCAEECQSQGGGIHLRSTTCPARKHRAARLGVPLGTTGGQGPRVLPQALSRRQERGLTGMRARADALQAWTRSPDYPR